MSPSMKDLPSLFERTPVPTFPKAAAFVRTAACLIIGDEVLNGKTHDTNSHRMAKLCFELGLDMKRVEVIPDDEDDIVETARRLSSKYDWVITSGGIGPTPDDITYEALGKAFGEAPLVYHEETLRRMDISAQKLGRAPATGEAREAQKRMALFPQNAEVIFPTEQFWVPVVRMNGNVCILPGIPSLFENLLLAMPPYLNLDPSAPKPMRRLIHTTLPESVLSPLLQRLTTAGKKDGIRVGSYPKWAAGVHISLIGHDASKIQEYTDQVIHETGGHVVEL